MLLVSLLRVLAASCLAGALFVLAYMVVASPSRPPSRLGVRGLKRMSTLKKNGLWAQLEPSTRWLGTRLSGLLSPSARTSLDRQITLAGDFWGLTPEEAVALTLISSSLGALFGSLFSLAFSRGALYPLVGTFVFGLLPYLQINGLQQERQKRIQTGLPYVIDLLALGLSAGLDFTGSLRQVVDKSSNPDDPLIEELSIILQELSVGKTRKQALLQLSDRVGGESVREFVSAVVQAEERGSPLSDVLRIQAQSSRQRRSVRAEEAAATASVKMLLPMVLLFLAILMLIVTPMMMQIGTQFSR
jgi:tight adherence protein C